MKTMCPDCERPTYWRVKERRETGRYMPALPEGYLSAVIEDGSCVTCYRARNGTTTAAAVSPRVAGVGHRPPLTDAEIELARHSLAKLWEDRRARGVPVGGVDPAYIRRRGLSLLEA